MERNFKNLFGLISEKSVPAVDSINEQGRGGIAKSYIPQFFYKPPFGYPRFVDIPLIRRLAGSPFPEMCISTIIDNISAIPWDIVPEDETIELTPAKEAEQKQMMDFFRNPNTNKDSWDKITRMVVRDILEIDSGVLQKIFNLKEEMVEVVARDGATFTKNPDLHGFITNRDDIIFDNYITGTDALSVTDQSQFSRIESQDAIEPAGSITPADVRERAAYFQYGWITGARPIPFGKKEIVWLERNPRTDNVYGRSPIENLAESIQTLIYAVEHNLDYFADNSIPPGVLGLDGSDAEECKSFKEQWNEQQRTKGNDGKWKKLFHHMPIVGKTPHFERLGFTNAELQLIEGQKWWSKMVWACFGVTSTELGYTEDAAGLANQIVQSEVFRKRAVNPILRILEYHWTQELISEFEFKDWKFKYMYFDVEAETKKATLAQIQIDTGIRTVNEIRRDDGLEEVEWGDDDPKRNQGTNMNFNNGNPEEQEQTRKEDASKQESRTDKPKEKKPEKKAEENPLIPKLNEQMDDEKLRKSIVYLMKENEKKIKSLIDKEMAKDQLTEIKGLNEIAKAIKKLVTFQGLKSIADMVIKNTFLTGWDNAEKQLEQNLMINKDAISFIQDYTFNNIVDMTEEIKNDLRAELERGIMGNEGISNIKARIEKVFDVGSTRAQMIARTETNRAENQGKLQAFKSSSEDFVKQWVSSKDDRTSPLCMRLNGQKVGINENFEDKSTSWEGPCPPSHVNCRSTVIYLSKDEITEQKNREEDLEIKRLMRQKDFNIKNRKEKLLNILKKERKNLEFIEHEKAKDKEEKINRINEGIKKKQSELSELEAKEKEKENILESHEKDLEIKNKKANILTKLEAKLDGGN